MSPGRSKLDRGSIRVRARARSWSLERRVVWVLGSPRSGSTWLLNLLARSVGATAVDEPLIGSHLATPVGAVSGLPSPTDRLIIDASADREDYLFSAAYEPVWGPALRALVLQRFAASSIRQGRSRSDLVVVKEPNGSLAAPVLLRIMPRSRLLFLVRDGRDVVDSTLDGVTDGWITEVFGLRLDGAEARQRFLEARAQQWVRMVDAVQRAYNVHDPALRHRVTYEDLRREPIEHLTSILRWLGREDAVPLASSAVEQLSFERLPADAKGPGKFARAATPGLWRERFSEPEVATLEAIMGPTLEALGYQA